MAGTRVRGITIELGADASGVSKALSSVDKELKKTQSSLKDVNKLLKLDPKNTELLAQKQKLLKDAIDQTSEKITQLKEAQSHVKEGTKEWDALQREIVDNENKLKGLKKEYRDFGSVASQQIKAVGKQMQDAGKKIEGFGKSLSGISAGAAAIGGGLLKLGYDAVTSADQLNTLSKQTGFTTDEIQKMQYAADLIDVSFEDISGALKKFKGKIDPANESLKKLGVETQNADGSLRDANDVFFDTVQALSGIDNETERDQAAMELFGKSADSLAGLIDDGGEALREFGQQAEDLGLILDADTISSLNETNDTIDSLKANLAGTAAQIGADVGTVLAPILEQLAGIIAGITEKLRALTPEQTETILKIVGIVAALAPAIIIISKLVAGISGVVSVIGTVVGVLGGPLTLAIAAIIAIGVLLYKNWDKIKEFAGKLWSGIKAGWEAVKNGVTNAVNTIRDNVKSRMDQVKQTFEQNGGGIKGALAVAWEGIKQQWTAGFNALDQITGGKLTELKNKFIATFNNVKATIASIWEKIKGLFTGSIKLPKIPLPHFSIQPPGWKVGDLLQGKIPKLNIKWYKKAYDNPVMFTNPTVMATPNGYKGFGDGTGAEIVLGLDKLRELVGGMDNNVNVTVVLEGDARNLFKMVQKTNMVRTKATSYNALAAGG